MKKLLLISCAAILLTACGGTSGSEANSSTKTPAKRDFLKDVATIEEKQNYHAEAFYSMVNVTDEFTPYGVLEQYNSNALYWIDGENSIGVLNNGSYGMFEYTIEDNKVALGNFVNFSGGYSLGDYFSTPYPLFKSDYWTLSNSGEYYECINNTALEVFAELTGIADMANKYKSKYVYSMIKGSYDDNGTMVLTMNSFKNDKLICIGKLTVNGFGETHNAPVEEFVKTEVKVDNPTDWTERQKYEIKEFFGGDQAADLPFPKGASYAITVKGLEQYREAMISDIGCGDISQTYLEQLKSAGFAVTPTDSYYYCSKVASFDKTKVTYEVYMSYYSKASIAAQYGEETAVFYPKGRFQIEISSSKSTNTLSNDGSLAEFESWMNANVSYKFPASGWTDVTSVNYVDRTETYNGYYASEGIQYESVTSVKFYIPTEEGARNDFTSYSAKLLALGFEKEEIVDGGQTYYYFKLGKVEVDFCVYSPNGKYGGFLQAMYWVEK